MPSLNKHPQSYGPGSGHSFFVKIAIATAFVLFYFALSIKWPIVKMASPQPPNPDIPIQVFISEISSIPSETSKSPVVNLKVSLQNTSPDKPVSFLRWSSPLDSKAGAMGIYVFTSKSSGEPAPSLNLKLNRMMPKSGVFSSEDTIRIEAGGKIESDVEIKAPEVVLKKGEKYLVSAKGWWMHVLPGDHAELKTAHTDGVLMGGYESEAVEFEVPS